MIALADGGAVLVAPELALVAGLVAILTADLVPAARRLAPWCGLAACIAGLALLPFAGEGTLASMLAVDGIAHLARLVIPPVAALVLLAGIGERRQAGDGGAWSAAVVGLALGAMLAAAAANFVALWLGLELVALASVALAAFRGGDKRSAEAGMKLVLFGGAASAAMLFGISHVYGATGHLDFAGIGAAYAAGLPPAAGLALLLAAVGVLFKLTLVPFHFFAPDVYQGAPALGVAAVSTLPKIGALAALLRALQLMAPAALVSPQALATGIALLAATSVLYASFAALAQRDAKRIVAFSGMGHGAAAVLALACLPGPAATAAAAFYVLTYVSANVGALVCLAVLERARGSTGLDALAGAWRQHPWLVGLLCLFLLSLAGVPPLAGFLGKWGVLQVAFARGTGDGAVPALGVAALLFLVASAIAIWSYLLIVRAVLFAEPAGDQERRPGDERVPLATHVVLAITAAATIGFGLWLDGLASLGEGL